MADNHRRCFATASRMRTDVYSSKQIPWLPFLKLRHIIAILTRCCNMSLEATRWTIDREKNVFLIWGHQEREESYDFYFLLCWNNTPISVKLSKTWINRETCEWQLLYIKIPEDLREKTGEIVQSLKDALIVYGFNGSPDEPFDTFNKNIKVQFSF